MITRKKNKAALELPTVSISEGEIARYLHLGTPWVQGSMRLKEPFVLDLEYIQRMMAWLLFTPADEDLTALHAMQLGLGAAALTKFHYKVLGMRTTAIEINPQVIAACRGWFKLPPDNERLQVLQADAGAEIRRPHWQGTVHALQVDLYDHDAGAPVLDSPDFYADCRALLAPEGCMTVNLFGRRSSYAASLERICTAFGPQNVWAFKPTREGNTIVLALRVAQPQDVLHLQGRAQAVQAQYRLAATKWLKVLRPVAENAACGG